MHTKERKEGERMSCKRKGTRAHDRKGHESLGTRQHPFLEAERVRPAFRALRLGQRARKGDEEATSSSRPSLAALEGAWGLQCPRRVGSGEWRQRPLAPSEGAGCGALRAFLGLAFTPPPPGEAAPAGRRPGAGRPRGLPEAGRVLQTLLEIHRHLHPASASPRWRRWKSRGGRGSGRAGDPDGYGGLTAATSAAPS